MKNNKKELSLILKTISIMLIGAFVTGGVVSKKVYEIKEQHSSELSYLEEKYDTNDIRKNAIINKLNNMINGLKSELDEVPNQIETAINDAIVAKTPEIISEYKKQLEEEQRLLNESISKKAIASRGASVNNEANITYKKSERVKIEYTYYYADDTLLQGGFNDKQGKLLKSHNYPIVALPSYVGYGSELVLDESIPYTLDKNYSNRFINVDTGGAIVDKGYDKNGIRILRCDVFVPDAYSVSSIVNNLNNGTVYGTLYYK